MNKINLGDKVKDPISGYVGIAVGKTTWLYGCTRISVQMKGFDKDGNLYPLQSFDEPQLKVMVSKKEKEATKTQRADGGPRPNVYQKEGVIK